MDRTWDRLTKALEDPDFPASKEEIVAHAGRRGADPETLRLVRALPLATYRNTPSSAARYRWTRPPTRRSTRPDAPGGRAERR
jgi:uncharacterized protein DUF2795